MLEEITKEKTSADHLLYVSLKYTKTCDVILNLIARWKSLIENSYDAILEKAFEEGKIPSRPATPKQRIEFIKKYFKKSIPVAHSLPLYLFFKKVPELDKSRDGEFRKNVNLKITEPGKVTNINMEKLGEYSKIMDEFVNEIRRILLK